MTSHRTVTKPPQKRLSDRGITMGAAASDFMLPGRDEPFKSRFERIPAVVFVLLVLAALLPPVVGCASSVTPAAPRNATRPAEGVRSYLLNPVQSFDLSVGADEAVRLDRGFDALLNRGAADVALQVARELLSRNDALPPAIVLAAQVAFVAGDHDQVVERLQGVVKESPDYQAALLVLARSFDLLGREVEAFELYRRFDPGTIGARRAQAIGEDVREELVLALATAFADDNLERGQRIALTMKEFFPNSIAAFSAQRDLALFNGDKSSELEARRALVDLQAPQESQEQRRLAELEVEIGDPTQGLEILEGLVEDSPGDYALLEALDAARFSWRLTMLPPGVVRIVESEALSRAEFASLLYWVVPGVRTGVAGAARIATDIPVDHAYRREVVRIINMGIMPMADQALRRFAPEAKIALDEALDVLLRIPHEFEITTACADRYVASRRKSERSTCDTAARCGLVGEAESCLTGGFVSGSQAKELIRRTLNLLGGTRP